MRILHSAVDIHIFFWLLYTNFDFQYDELNACNDFFYELLCSKQNFIVSSSE